MTPHAAQKLMQGFVKANDLPRVNCHSLRHCFATAAILNGAPVELVSKMLGHTNITTTYDRYVKPQKADLDAIRAVLDKAVNA